MDDNEFDYLIIDFKLQNDSRPVSYLPKQIYRLANEEERIMDLFHHILLEFQHTSTYSSQIVELAVNSIILYAFNESTLNNLELEIRGKTYISDITLNAINYIETYYYSDLSLACLAESLSVSKSLLSKKFKEDTQQSPQQYWINYRLKIAHELLSSRDYSIQQAAHETGHRNLQHFSSQFSRKFAYPPSKVRKKLRLE